jgi:hypothetical protein
MGPINAKITGRGLRKRAAVTRPKFREETPEEGVLNKYKKIVPKKHEMPH